MSKDKSVNLLPGAVLYVLEDGETYSGEPAVALSVSGEELERIVSGEKIYNVVPDWATRGEE
tara:strand:+ start:806 stop:991 length:186 start_codon:yes stop_codon:yes gene_type:complete